MTSLICLRGYSGAGKSTKAREIAKEIGGVVVNRDLLRQQLLGSWWTGDGKDEDRVTLAEEAQVEAFLRNGISTVIDATHLNPRYLRKWARLSTKLGVDFGVVDVHADPAECRKRVYQRWCSDQDSEFARYLDPKVVDQQVKHFPVEKWPTITAEPFIIEPAQWVKGLPSAVIVDIDGTLAHIPEGGRSPYDYTRVHEDIVDPAIKDIVRSLPDYWWVLIVTGRDDECRDVTQKWLQQSDIPWDFLYMRPSDAKDERGNKLPDYQVKYALFNDYIRGKYNVHAVFDDRLQVCEMWHKLGLKLLRVGDPNADF